MTTDRRWQSVLAMLGSAGFATPLARRQYNQRHDVEKQQRNHDLQAWEDDGGSSGGKPVIAISGRLNRRRFFS